VAENAWSSSLSTSTTTVTAAATTISTGASDPAPFKWPLIAYLAVLVGAPYLTWKLVSSSEDQVDRTEKKVDDWMTGETYLVI
jgi:hypothetical protein